MRQRKVKNLEEKLERVSAAYIQEPKAQKGRWAEAFCRLEAAPLNHEKARALYLELGCGKGNFILAHGAKNPEGNYIGIEGQESVVLRALEKCEELGLGNVRFSGEFISDIEEYFGEGELDGLYLNFSDPWPKDRHAKRRLTYRKKLMAYGRIIRPGGFIEIKTDNDALFDFTLEEIQACGFPVDVCSRDLHGDCQKHKAAEITTEYEEKFRTAGKNINYVRILNKIGNHSCD